MPVCEALVSTLVCLYFLLSFSLEGGFVPPGGAGGAHTVRLSMGMFQIYPASGIVLPGSSTTVTVDMVSEIPMIGEEVRFCD